MSGLFQIGGLLSGLDTRSMIDQLLALEARPLARLQTRQAAIAQRIDAYREINTRLASLQSAASNLTLRSTLNTKAATVDNPTNQPNVLTASVGPDAAHGSFNVTVSQLATATRVGSSAAVGQAVDVGAALASAGFHTSPTTGTFTLRTVDGDTINSATLTIDENTVLSDGVDDASSNSILGKINNAGIGLTASIVNDADGRPNLLQLAADPGLKVQMGAGSDTSNFLTAARLKDAIVQGVTPATVTGNTVAGGAIASTTITINSVTTVTNQTTGSPADKAASIAADINNTPGTTVTANGNADGTITLTQKTLGSGHTIDITEAGTGTGLVVGETANGADGVTSFAPLGVAKLGEPMTSADARLATAIAGLDGDNKGSFKINGVEITYFGSESISAVLGRINSSSAGVSASYDPMTDRISIQAAKTGGDTITFEDVQGNFLTAVGVADATQELGQNALYSIDTVAGGEQLSSSSNTITGIIPGVTLQLKSTHADPVKVTVSQDPQTTVAAVKTFVERYNSAVELIRHHTRIDPTGQQTGLLANDTSIEGLARTLRSRLLDAAVGMGGSIQSLADVGLSFGQVGSAVGTTNTLKLDENKLGTALQENPNAVHGVFGGFTSTATLDGGGSIESISGAPTSNHQSGSYEVVVTEEGAISATFTPTNGAPGQTVTGTITAGGTNTSLIPGVTLTAAGVLSDSTQTIQVEVQTRGVMIGVNSFLISNTSSTGLLGTRREAADAEIARLGRQRHTLEDRLAERERRLVQQFTALEVALSKLQQQSAQLSMQLAALQQPRQF